MHVNSSSFGSLVLLLVLASISVFLAAAAAASASDAQDAQRQCTFHVIERRRRALDGAVGAGGVLKGSPGGVPDQRAEHGGRHTGLQRGVHQHMHGMSRVRRPCRMRRLRLK